MLTPAQVIPFLSHDDIEVRGAARRYLVSAHDPAPATADDFWAAVDTVGRENAAGHIDQLGLVPQTDASVKRLLEELTNTDPVTAESLQRTLERIELNLLRSHWDAIRAVESLPPRLTAHLQSRLDLANEPAEPLWDRLMTFAASLGDTEPSEEQELELDRYIEAVARHPDLFRERVLVAMQEKNLTDWQSLVVTDLAGQMRLSDAVGPLLERLTEDDSDLMWEVAGDALVHIGDDNVIRQIVERFADEGEGFQISAAAVLGRIKRPESQTAVLQLLDASPDSNTLMPALIELLPDDEPTISRLRERVREGRYDRQDIHLDEELIQLSTMTGVDLPEADEWRQQIEQKRAQWAQGMSNVDHLFQPPSSMGPATLHAAPLTRAGTAARRGMVEEQPARRPSTGPQPFRNATAKVGRNDPCPCGSGKKHKKCCGK